MAAPIAYASGRVFGPREKISVRIRYGKMHLYVLNNPPEDWSENQKRMRKSFGLASYYARVILDVEGARARFEVLKRRQKKYVRVDNMVAHMLKELMQTDETVAAQAWGAYDEWNKADVMERTAVRERHVVEAKNIAERMMES